MTQSELIKKLEEIKKESEAQMVKEDSWGDADAYHMQRGMIFGIEKAIEIARHLDG